MGIIDRSITYAIFFALPLSLLLALLWPFFAAWTADRPLRLRGWRPGLLLALGVYLTFHGPLIGAVLAVLLGGGLLAWAWQRRRGTSPPLSGRAPFQLGGAGGWLVAALGLLSLYSLYLGRFNSENEGAQLVPLTQRYWLLLRGIGAALTGKLGLPLLLLAVLTNAGLLARRRPPTPAGTRLLALLRALAWFAAAYLLLLPLGGYRAYRPLILRYDTLLPLTLGLLLAYAATALYLLRTLPGPARRWYAAGLIGFSAVYLNADRPLRPAASNAYERQALARLAATPAPVVALPAGGTLLSWRPLPDYHASEAGARLLYHWKITPEVRRYYQPEPASGGFW